MSDGDRNKFYNKKKFITPTKEANNFGSRLFKNTSNPTSDSDKFENKTRSVKKTTILAREHHPEDRSVSPKNVAKDSDSSQSINISGSTNSSEEISPKSNTRMSKCVKLLDDGVICSENIQDFLQQDNDDYLVVGVVGGQGVGKSTLLNLLAHHHLTDKLKKKIFSKELGSEDNWGSVSSHSSDSYNYDSDSDIDNTVGAEGSANLDTSGDEKFEDKISFKIREETPVKIEDVIFEPQSLNDLGRNQYRTSGIDFFVTHNRVMFLDCQPFNSASVLDELIRNDNKLSSMANEFMPLENVGEILGLQMTAFLLSVCHVVILVQDWFFDSNVLRFIQSAEMLKPTISNPEDEHIDHFPHLILVHNKAKMDDFSPNRFKKMQQIYKGIFNKTKLHLESNLGLGCGKLINSLSPENCGDPINLFLIPAYDESLDKLYQGHPGLEELIRYLRSHILGATKYPLNNVNEKHWLLYCTKVWDHVKKSNFFIEYNKLMP